MPVEPRASKPQPPINPQRHVHRDVVRQRGSRIVSDLGARLGPAGPLAAPAVPQPVEVELCFSLSTSLASIPRRASEFCRAVSHAL